MSDRYEQNECTLGSEKITGAESLTKIRDATGCSGNNARQWGGSFTDNL